jgi:hypothetical protein
VLVAALAKEMDTRGGDSWGVVTRKMRVYKGLGKAWKGLPLEQLSTTSQAMGHARHKTTGDINLPNAHPLFLPGIVGCHNGTVSNWAELNRKRGQDNSWAVDSSHIFTYIRNGWPQKEVHGYGAITYIRDDHPRRIWLGRFNGGSLAVFGIAPSAAKEDQCAEKSLGIIYASTVFAVEAAAAAAGIKNIFSFNVEEGKLYYLNDGTYWTTGPECDFDFSSSKYTWDGAATNPTTRPGTGNRTGWKATSAPSSQGPRSQTNSNILPINSSTIPCEFCEGVYASAFNTRLQAWLCKLCLQYDVWLEDARAGLGLFREAFCEDCQKVEVPAKLCHKCDKIYTEAMQKRERIPKPSEASALYCRTCQTITQYSEDPESLCPSCLAIWTRFCVEETLETDAPTTESSGCSTKGCLEEPVIVDNQVLFCGKCYPKREGGGEEALESGAAG